MNRPPAAARLARAESEVASALLALQRALVQGADTTTARAAVAQCERRRREIEAEIEQADADAAALAQELVVQAAHKLLTGITEAMAEMRAHLVVPTLPERVAWSV